MNNDTKQNTSGEKILEKYEEKRVYPRIVIDRPIAMVLSNGQALEALAHDISPGGIQVRCNLKAAQILKTEKENLGKKAALDFEVNFILPLEDKQVKVLIRCKPSYLVKLEDDAYAMGLQFTKVGEDSRKILKRFIEVSMEPG